MHPDSILVVQDHRSGAVGYVLPHHAAEYFRDLFYYAQAMEVQLDTLAYTVAVHREKAASQQARILLLESIHRDLAARTALYEHDLAALQETLEVTNEARKRERRWKRFWRATSFVLAGTTTALGFLR